MTLEEFITYFEEQSKEHTNLVPYDVDEEYNRNCRQLAEWLRELKIHREIHDVLLQMLVNLESDACCIDLMNDANEFKICEENCTNNSKGCWVRWAKLKAREVNADE